VYLRSSFVRLLARHPPQPHLLSVGVLALNLLYLHLLIEQVLYRNHTMTSLCQTFTFAGRSSSTASLLRNTSASLSNTAVSISSGVSSSAFHSRASVTSFTDAPCSLSTSPHNRRSLSTMVTGRSTQIFRQQLQPSKASSRDLIIRRDQTSQRRWIGSVTIPGMLYASDLVSLLLIVKSTPLHSYSTNDTNFGSSHLDMPALYPSPYQHYHDRSLPRKQKNQIKYIHATANSQEAPSCDSRIRLGGLPTCPWHRSHKVRRRCCLTEKLLCVYTFAGVNGCRYFGV
jgi:hypothetical protein